MNWYSIFYWLVVADNARTLFWIAAVILAICCFITAVIWADQGNSTKFEPRLLVICIILDLLCWSGVVFTPSKKDSLLIIAGGGALQFLTTDSTARQIPKEALLFVSSELRAMAKEAEVEIHMESEKERILKEIKEMPFSQISERMKTDSTFSKIILQEVLNE